MVRMTGITRNGPLFEQHASLSAIDAEIVLAVAAREKADREIGRLTELRAHRAAQIAAGTWPAGKEER